LRCRGVGIQVATGQGLASYGRQTVPLFPDLTGAGSAPRGITQLTRVPWPFKGFRCGPAGEVTDNVTLQEIRLPDSRVGGKRVSRWHEGA
jgi:hypothetical protein